MKAKSLAYLEEEKSNPYIVRVNAAILEEDDSTTDEMLIQKTFKGAGTIMGKGDDLEKSTYRVLKTSISIGLSNGSGSCRV